MTEENIIYAFREAEQSRRSWRCPSGKTGTVEEVAQEHYLMTRGFRGCLIDSACVYGGLAWMLFHDLLFHDNLNSKQPLCSSYLHTPKKFYERNRADIEVRLCEYQRDRNGVFARQMLSFRNHPFFTNPASKIAKHNGSWMIRNSSALSEFATMSVEHGQEELIREIILTSNRGRNAGWPDLVAWSETDLLFAEVKSTDRLSDAQHQWIIEHQNSVKIELIRIRNRTSNETMHTDQKSEPLHSADSVANIMVEL